MSATTITAKIRFGDDVRRVFITTDGIDFAKLSALLRSKFQCQDDVLIIKYVDDESDLVTITDDDELKMALLIAAEMEGPFRLELMGQAAEPTVTPKEEEPAPDAAGGFDFGAGCGQDVQHSFGGGRHGHRGRHGHGRHGHGHGWRGRHHGHGHGHGHGWHAHAHGHKEGKKEGWKEARKARFIADVTLPDGTVVEAGSKVTKIWKLHNHGSKDWSEGTQLLHVGGDTLLETAEPVIVDAAGANAEIDVAVDLVAPDKPGRYISYFRLAGPRGMRFGQRIWVTLVVAADSADQDQDLSAESSDGAAESKEMRKAKKQAQQQQKQREKMAQKRAKAEQLGAKAAKIREQVAAGKKKGSDVAALIEKLARIEAKSAKFVAEAAELQVALAPSVTAELTAEQREVVIAAGLTDAQMQEVCEAVRTQRHLGIVCDETQQSPIVGVRFTKPHGADTYDLCEAAFRKLAPEAQEAFEAVPTPDVKIVVANVKAKVAATEEAEPPAPAAEAPSPEPEPEPESAGSDGEESFEMLDDDDDEDEAKP